MRLSVGHSHSCDEGLYISGNNEQLTLVAKPAIRMHTFGGSECRGRGRIWGNGHGYTIGDAATISENGRDFPRSTTLLPAQPRPEALLRDSLGREAMRLSAYRLALSMLLRPQRSNLT